MQTTASAATLSSDVALLSKNSLQAGRSKKVVTRPQQQQANADKAIHLEGRRPNSGQNYCIEKSDHEINDIVMITTQGNSGSCIFTTTPSTSSITTTSTTSLTTGIPTNSEIITRKGESIYDSLHETTDKNIIPPLTNIEVVTSGTTAYFNQYNNVKDFENNINDKNEVEKHITEDKLKQVNENFDDPTVFGDKNDQLLESNFIKFGNKNSISHRINKSNCSNLFTSPQISTTKANNSDVINTVNMNSTATTNNNTATVRLREKRAIFNNEIHKNNGKVSSNSNEKQSIPRNNETKANSPGSLNLMSGLGYNYTSRHSLDSYSPMSVSNSAVQLRDKETSRVMETAVSSSLSCNAITTASKTTTERRPSWRLKFDSVSKVCLSI